MKKILLTGLLACFAHDGCNASINADIESESNESSTALETPAQKFAAAQDAAKAKSTVSQRVADERTFQELLIQQEQELKNEFIGGIKIVKKDTVTTTKPVRMPSVVRRPVSELAVRIFTAKCFKKHATSVEEEKVVDGGEYNLRLRRDGAPQVFKVIVDGKKYVVRTVAPMVDEDTGNPLRCYFNDERVAHLRTTQKELEHLELGVSLIEPLNFAVYDLDQHEIRVVNSLKEIKKGEVQMCLMRSAEGISLKDVFDDDMVKIAQIIQRLVNGEPFDEGMKTTMKASFDRGYLVGKALANLHKIGYEGAGRSSTVHGDTTERNVYINNKEVIFIDTDRFGGDDAFSNKHSIDYEIRSLLCTRYPAEALTQVGDNCIAGLSNKHKAYLEAYPNYIYRLTTGLRYGAHSPCIINSSPPTVASPYGVPFTVGFLNGYKSTFPETIPDFQAKRLLSEQEYGVSTLDYHTKYMIYNIFYRSYGSDVLLDTQGRNASLRYQYKILCDSLATAMGLWGENVNFEIFARVMTILHTRDLLKFPGWKSRIPNSNTFDVEMALHRLLPPGKF
ncbi:hypothetical protein FACS1894122_01240 [Alphaproteobacteria bacterium]|nr:hypothetical protein FACS1894122_01240 [Alphaproteobacteria bacterium]